MQLEKNVKDFTWYALIHLFIIASALLSASFFHLYIRFSSSTQIITLLQCICLVFIAHRHDFIFVHALVDDMGVIAGAVRATGATRLDPPTVACSEGVEARNTDL